MRLSTRRTIRRWFLEAPDGTVYGLTALAIGVAALGVLEDAGGVVIAAGVFGAGVWFLRQNSRDDACPTCNSRVDALDERFCSTCGERLDDLDAAPPIDDRVDERFRPVGLEDLERTGPPKEPATPVADGGEDVHEEDG